MTRSQVERLLGHFRLAPNASRWWIIAVTRAPSLRSALGRLRLLSHGGANRRLRRNLAVGARNGQGPDSTRADLRPKKKLGLGHCETPPPRRSARRLGQAPATSQSRVEGPQSGRDCFAGTRNDGSSCFMPCRGAPTPPGSAPRSTPGSMLSARSTRPRPNSARNSATSSPPRASPPPSGGARRSSGNNPRRRPLRAAPPVILRGAGRRAEARRELLHRCRACFETLPPFGRSSA